MNLGADLFSLSDPRAHKYAKPLPKAASWKMADELLVAVLISRQPLAAVPGGGGEVETRIASYTDPEDARLVAELLNQYSMDKFGNGAPLPEDVLSRLAPELAQVAGAFSVVATVDGAPAGLVNCFQGFSTFRCRPLLNVHDCYVAAPHRRRGITQAMLAAVEAVASERGCCKLTLEVLPSNEAAAVSTGQRLQGQTK
eukprot:jgi/Tetstr1/426612/TSEL_016889.t1